MGHDRIMPFRAALVGTVIQVGMPMTHLREYPEAAHKRMFFEP